MTHCETCHKSLQSSLNVHEMMMCDHCYTHFHLVLTKRQRNILISLLGNYRNTIAQYNKPELSTVLNGIDELLEMVSGKDE